MGIADKSTINTRKRIAKWGGFILIFCLIVSLSVFIFISRSGISIFSVRGVSMEPTLSNLDTIVLKSSKTIEKGHIIVFNQPEKWDYSGTPDNVLIKRVVGIPGDTILSDGESLFINGEEYINFKDNNYECKNGLHNTEYVLNPKQVFVVGDNFNHSLDSLRIFCDGEKEFLIHSRLMINYGTITNIL